MTYIPVQLTRHNGSPVSVNAAAITGLIRHQEGRLDGTLIRTVDGNEWLVCQTFDQVTAAIGEALSPLSSLSAPMVVETKGKAKK